MGSDQDVDSAKDKNFQPADLYHHVESWWGEPFDDKLIERIVTAPKEHQRAFSESLEDLRGGLVESLSEIPPGVLRPTWRHTLFPSTAPGLKTQCLCFCMPTR